MMKINYILFIRKVFLLFLLFLSIFSSVKNEAFAKENELISSADTTVKNVGMEFEEEKEEYKVGDIIKSRVVLDFGGEDIGGIELKVIWSDNLILNNKDLSEEQKLSFYQGEICEFNEIAKENSIQFICFGDEGVLMISESKLRDLEFKVIEEGEIIISIQDVSTAKKGEGEMYNSKYIFNKKVINGKTSTNEETMENNVFTGFNLSSVWDNQYGIFRGSSLILMVFTFFAIILLFLGKVLLRLIKNKVKNKKIVTITMFGIIIFSLSILASFVFLNKVKESLDERSDASEIEISHEFEWVRTWGGTKNDEIYKNIIDSSGNIYVGGRFSGSVDFDYTEGVEIKNSSANSTDAFLSKHKEDGSFGGVITFGGGKDDFIENLDIDSFGNIYMVGNFASQPADFDFTEGITSISSIGKKDSFITKQNADGSYGWTKTFGGAGDDYGVGIVVDSDDNIYVAGSFSDTVDFRSGEEISDTRISNGGIDVYITRYNADGSYGWTKTFGGSENDTGRRIAVDSNDNIYVGGAFRNTVDFRSGEASSDIRVSNGKNDAYITKYNTDGSYGWTKAFGGIEYDEIYSIAIDSEDNLYVGGAFSDTVDFRSGEASSDIKVSNGSFDAYLLKYKNVETACTPKCTGKCGGNDECGGICPNICAEKVATPYCKNDISCVECLEDSHCSTGNKCINNACTLISISEFPISLSEGCTKDSDCIYKNAQSCCSCNDGGAEVAILKNKEAEYNSFIGGLECEGVECPTVYQCQYFEHVSPACNTSTSTCTLNKCASFIDLNCSNTLTMSDYSLFVQDYLTFKRQGILNNRSNFAKSYPEKISVSDYQKFVQEYLRIKRGN